MNVIYYILFILFLIIYLISFKTVEGFDEFYGVTLPSSYAYDSTPSKTINKFGFYKGKGTFKKGYTSQSKSDGKISTLNKLLNKLLGNLINDDQDCIGEFGKYSECDKSCGSNAYQTRTYNVKQKRGKNGKACPYDDGYEEKKICNLDYCQLGDICKENADCESGNCNPNSTRCENMVPCSKENVHVCNKNECMDLNDEYKDDPHMLDGSYLYNNVDEQCFFKSKTEIEKLNLDIYTYNFRDIKQKVEDYVLDCKYYQIKKDGDGPCVNSPNIIMDDDEEPTCLPGFGPEPTPLNGSNACKDCIIKNDSGDGYLDNDKCFCPTGRRFKKESNTCSEEIAETNNVCSSSSDNLELIQFDNGNGCQYCPSDYSIKKDGNTLSCIKCGENELTISGYCRENCNSGDVNSELCDQYCEMNDGGGYEINKDNLIFNVDGSLVNGLPPESADYQEQCMAFAPANTSCPLGSSRVNESCVCSGDNMKRNIIDDNDPFKCSNSCNPGYYYNSDTHECDVCLDQTGCKTHSDTVNCIFSADGNTRYKYCLEAENTGEDLNNYYVDQGQVRTCPGNFWNADSNTCSGGCHEGEYNTGDASNIQCVPCPANTIGESVTINGSDTACSPCGAGTESEPGSTICSPCDPGKYRSEGMNTPCQPCSGGTYSKNQGSTECTPCPKGSYSIPGSPHCLVKEDCWDKSDPSEFGTNLLESGEEYLNGRCGDPLCEDDSLCSSCDKYSRINFGNPYVVYQTDDKPWLDSSCPTDVSGYPNFTDQGTLKKRCDNYYYPEDTTISDGGITYNDGIIAFNLLKQQNDEAVFSHKSVDNCKVEIPCYPVRGTGNRSHDLNIKRCYKFPTDDELSSSTASRIIEIKSIKDLHKSGYDYNHKIYSEPENR